MKVFTNYFEKNYEEIIPEPDWEFMFFKYLPEEMVSILCGKIKEISSPFKFFLHGLQYEFGISKKQKYKKALKYYEKGLSHKEPFSCYRLFFIHRKNSSDFSVTKNLDLAIIYLIYSSVYLNFTPRLYNIDPKYYLAFILDTEDNDKKKSNSVIAALTNIDKDEARFLNCFFNFSTQMIRPKHSIV